MNTINRLISSSDKLAADFLQRAKEFQANIEVVKVLKSRTYKIAEANVLIRAASEGKTRRYFFGLNYLTAEEMNNLDNPFIAFICGSLERVLILPAKLFFQYLPQISHDRNGEYKIIIDQDFNIALLGKGNRLNCNPFVNNWNLLLSSYQLNEKNTVEESLHSVIQGRVLEIGNMRGFRTFCPDKSKKFNDKKLSDIASVDKCPELQFSSYDLLRKIDVIWFRERGPHLIPENAFEIELSTGTWSGVGRMATLMSYSNVGLYIISSDLKKFNQVMTSFPDYQDHYKHINTEAIGDLYSAEKNLKELRFSLGL